MTTLDELKKRTNNLFADVICDLTAEERQEWLQELNDLINGLSKPSTQQTQNSTE